MDKIVEKIIQYRTQKGYTYENMAFELDLTPAAYRKIETGETKLSVERLFKIAQILDAPVSEILGLNKNEMYQNNSHNENVYQQKIEHFYQENKDITEQLVKTKDELIESLRNEIRYLHGNNEPK